MPDRSSVRRGAGVAAVLALVAAGGVYMATRGALPPREAVAAPTPPSPPLPSAPGEWCGQIDYPALDARIQGLMADPDMAGLAAAVVENGRLSFVRGYGRTAIPDGEPVTPHTVFRWASVSKTAAGALAARLARDGAFSLGDPLSTFATSLRLPADGQATLTVEQLLSQRTGLPRNAYDDRLEHGEPPAAIRRAYAGLAPICAPGACHSYQNVAFDAVGEIVTATTGEAYEAAVTRRLFTPLGMSATSLGLEGLVGAESWARPHEQGRSGSLSEPYYGVPAAAGVNSDIVDLARWMQALMGAAPDVLPPAVLAEMRRPRGETRSAQPWPAKDEDLGPSGYGLGVRTFAYKGRPLVGHSGGLAGYRAAMLFDPDARTGVVMLWNSRARPPFALQLDIFRPPGDPASLERPMATSCPA